VSIENLLKRDKILAQIKKSLSKKFDNVEVTAFGSSANSLWNNNSDIDLEILLEDYLGENPCDLLNMMLPHFKEFAKGRYIDKIFGSRIPLLKFTWDAYDIEIDVTVNNKVGVHNS